MLAQAASGKQQKQDLQQNVINLLNEVSENYDKCEVFN